ncbi:MAG: triose-phosphate isomerase, partial [Ferrovum sp.]|nr:triose-phosphate isomerase [Ferrovum sp.]
MRHKLIAGNWKMHGACADNAALVEALLAAERLSGVDYAVLVPAPYLAQMQTLLTGSSVAWGGQDVSEETKGAFTGEVAASMLREFGCRYTIVGHSERRQRHGESDSLVAAKARTALAYQLTPIVCLGESLAQRESGETAMVVRQQLAAVIETLGLEGLARIVLAYEPIWAIGTGRSATPEQAQEVHALLRHQVAAESQMVGDNLQILYGGSVKAANAVELMTLPDVDGALVGGASLV